MKKTIISAFILIFLFIACSKNRVSFTPDCTTTKSFVTDVSPLIQTSCAANAGCHATGSANGPGALTTYTQVFNARSAIRTAVANGSMPQNSSLSNTQKNNILCWIDAGAANN